MVWAGAIGCHVRPSVLPAHPPAGRAGLPTTSNHLPALEWRTRPCADLPFS